MTTPGGSPFNVAIGLGRLGTSTRLYSSIGDDDHGRILLDALQRSEVELQPAALEGRTATATAHLDESGQATYDFDISWNPRFEDCDWPPTTAIHFGSIAAITSPGARAVTQAVDAYVGKSFISYDPNCRPSLMPSVEQTRHQVEANVVRSDLVKLSDADAAWLYPGQPVETVAKHWLGLGPALVVLTRGAQGALAWTWETTTAVPAAPVAHLVDTVGAGDAFMAGLLCALPSLSASDVRQLSADLLTDVLRTASIVAAKTCERAGADPPWRREL